MGKYYPTDSAYSAPAPNPIHALRHRFHCYRRHLIIVVVDRGRPRCLVTTIVVVIAVSIDFTIIWFCLSLSKFYSLHSTLFIVPFTHPPTAKKKYINGRNGTM